MVALSFLALGLAACGQSTSTPASGAGVSAQRALPNPEEPSDPTPPVTFPSTGEDDTPIPAARKGMTWRLVSQSGDVVRVGYDATTNAYQGDTSVSASLPLLCFHPDGRQVPSGLDTGYDGWAGGEVKLSPAVPGTALTSLKTANAICSNEYGDGWRMAEFHDGPGGWRWYANGTVDANTRFWVAINDQKANPWDSAGTPEDPVIPETTKIADADTRSSLIYASEDGSQLVFARSTPRLDSLQPGDTLASLPTAAAPTGFLRKVTGVSRQGGQVVVSTEFGALEDAIQEASISYNAPLDLDQSDIQMASGVSLQAQRLGAQNLHKRFTLNQVTLFTCPSPSNGKATLDGFVDMDLNVFVHSKISWFSLKSLDAGVQFQENSELKLDAQCDYTKSFGPKEIANITGPLTVFFVGPVPVTVRPLVVISVGFDGKVSATLHLKVQQDANMKLGAQYDKGNGWSVINQRSNNFRFDVPTAQVDVSAKAYATVKAGALFYESGYVYGYGSPFLEFTASTAATPPCKLDAGIELGVGAALRIFGKTLAQQNWQLGAPRSTLWTGCSFGGGTGTGSATHAGMTWSVLSQTANVLQVGIDASSNVYQGDTPASAVLPVMCLYVDGRPVPAGVNPTYYHGWAEGAVNFTAPVSGTTLTSRAAADALCAGAFGAGWRMGEFHDGKVNGMPDGWRYYANGTTLPASPRFWVAINDQNANPWN